MNNILVGDFAEIKKAFSQEEVQAYTITSGDKNPIHYNKNYAKQTFFKQPIVPGLLAASLFGGLLGTHLPGEGTIHIGQELKFIKPIYIGEKVRAEIKVIHIRSDKPIITFSSICYNENGEIAIDGKSVVFYKGKYFK